MPQLRGTCMALWDDFLPPIPVAVQQANVRAVVERLVTSIGGPLARPPQAEGSAASLDEAESWRPTACVGWTVRDPVFHLLGDTQRALVALTTLLRDQPIEPR